MLKQCCFERKLCYRKQLAQSAQRRSAHARDGRLITPGLLRRALTSATILPRTITMDGTSSSGFERTFQYDDGLPSLPVPPLQQTLTKYVESVRPFLSADELQTTQRVVEEFGRDIGPTLHDKLVDRSKNEKNWLEQWWEDKAYLETRLPLGVLQNPTGFMPTQESVWPPREGTQLERGAITLWHLLCFYQLVRNEMIPVDKNRAGTKVFSMDQFRGMFHACREPGVEKDALFRCFKTEREGPCPTHIHVMSNGHIFKMTVVDEEGQLLSAPELHRQLTFIKGRSQERGQCIGALTADDRVSWAKSYQHLQELSAGNEEHLHTIKSSMFGFILDEGNPKNLSEVCLHGVAGPSPINRWFDKAYSVLVTSNGVVCYNSDHAPFDGMAAVVMTVYVSGQLLKDGGGWPDDPTAIRPDAPMPTELVFVVDQQVQEDIAHAKETYRKLACTYDVVCSFYFMFGKDFMKKHKMHPDATIQLALQLAYYTAFNRPGAAYETATTRQFYHGRTETLRSCTMEAIDWCRAMQNPQADPSHQLSLLRKAHDRHNSLMAEAANGQGIDRHLLGLYILSQEMGMPLPQLFIDKAFALSGGGGNFVLSTSTLGYTRGLATIAPMRHDGYMCCYRIGTEELQFTVSAFKTCPDTDANLFFQQITQALNRIGSLLLTSNL